MSSSSLDDPPGAFTLPRSHKIQGGSEPLDRPTIQERANPGNLHGPKPNTTRGMFSYSSSRKESNDADASSGHLYPVPRLQEPPRRRGSRPEDQASLKGDDHVLPSAQNSTGLRHVSPAFAPVYAPNSADFLSSASGSTMSSSLMSFRDTPLTPWDFDYCSPVKQTGQFRARSLRPTASTFMPPGSPALLQHQITSSQVFEANQVSPNTPLSAQSTFGPFYPIELAGLGISNLSLTSSAASSFPVSPAVSRSFEEPAYQGSQVKQHQTAWTGNATNQGSHEYAKFSPSSSHSFIASTSPGTTQATDDDKTCLIPLDDVSASGLSPCLSSSEGNGSLVFDQQTDEPPTWAESLRADSFQIQRLNTDAFDEPFEKAFDVLGTLNPEQYQMPYGSKVVCIKTTSFTNMVLSIKNGVWACQSPVTLRILKLWEERNCESEKVLLFFSAPGSKQFCGLAEMVGHRPDEITDFWEEGETIKGAILVKWLFCKTVPYDSIRSLTDGLFKNESATQMWSGMHYSDGMGREVIRCYVEHPHLQNIIAKRKLPVHESGPPTKRAGGTSRSKHNNRVTPQSRSAAGKNKTLAGNNLRFPREEAASTPRPSKLSQQRLIQSKSVGSLSTPPASRLNPEHRDGHIATMTTFVHKGEEASTAMPMSAPLQFDSVEAWDDHAEKTPVPRLPASHFFRDGIVNTTSRLGGVKGSFQSPGEPSFPQQSPQNDACTRSEEEGFKKGQYVGMSKSSTYRQAHTPKARSPFSPDSSNTRPGSYGKVDRDFTPTAPGSRPQLSIRYLAGPERPMGATQHLQTPNVQDCNSLGLYQERNTLTQSFPLPNYAHHPPCGVQSTTEGLFSSPGLSSPIPCDRPSTPKREYGRLLGHGVRGSEAKTSTDVRTDLWIEELLASPSRKSEQSNATPSFDGDGRYMPGT